MFGSKKNPFRATVFPDKPEPVPALEESGPGVATAPQVNASPVQDNHNLPPHEEHKPVREAIQPSEGTPKQGQQAAGEDSREVPARRSSAIRAFLLWRRVKKGAGQSAVKGRPLVQAELSLESVKVVRNDLSESDLEVVPAHGKRAGSEKPGTAQAPQGEESAESWGQTVGQLLTASET